MDFFWILIVIGVISTIISAVSKSKKREEERRKQQSGQPAPPRPLSDIQKAMMMAQETASQRPAAQPRPAYVAPQPGAQPNPIYAQQYGAQPRPAYTPQQTAAYTPVQARTAAPMEARNIAPMEARTSAPMEARTAAAVPPHPMYTAPRAAGTLPPDFYNGSMGAATTEGLKDDMEGGSPADFTRNLQSITEDDLETAKPLNSAASPSSQNRMSLKLFEGKNEAVKAVIYSEVLARRSPRRRTGRA